MVALSAVCKQTGDAERGTGVREFCSEAFSRHKALRYVCEGTYPMPLLLRLELGRLVEGRDACTATRKTKNASNIRGQKSPRPNGGAKRRLETISPVKVRQWAMGNGLAIEKKKFQTMGFSIIRSSKGEWTGGKLKAETKVEVNKTRYVLVFCF